MLDVLYQEYMLEKHIFKKVLNMTFKPHLSLIYIA